VYFILGDFSAWKRTSFSPMCLDGNLPITHNVGTACSLLLKWSMLAKLYVGV
jgi:hypothetical protein